MFEGMINYVFRLGTTIETFRVNGFFETRVGLDFIARRSNYLEAFAVLHQNVNKGLFWSNIFEVKVSPYLTTNF